MAYETIVVETKGRIGIITLNRPKVLNALSSALLADLNAALDAFEANDEITVIVVTGRGRAFAAGADVGEMRDKNFTKASFREFFTPWERLSACRKPVVAAVAGYALGGGCELAMMCDIIVAADTAKFGLPEVTIGIIPAAGGTQRLTRALGKAKAMDMILTGRVMEAEEAERAGLVSRVVPADDLIDETMKIAKRIAEMSRPIVEIAKESINGAFGTSLKDGVGLERKLAFAAFATDDRREGMSAFVEKRQPAFSHK